MNKNKLHISHTLTDCTLDEDGLVDSYKEFHKIDFSNEFEELEKPDYEIRASVEDEQNKNEEENGMKGTRKQSSYIGQLSSGYDATAQNDYNAGDVNGQAGKKETEEVTTVDNWKNDKRDAIGRAASVQILRRTAARLNKLADYYENDLEDLDDDDIDEDEFEALGQEPDGDECECDDDLQIEASNKSAAHPLEHDPKKDDPAAFMSSQTGDDEWISIGPGSFDDKRDDAGRALEGK